MKEEGIGCWEGGEEGGVRRPGVRRDVGKGCGGWAVWIGRRGQGTLSHCVGDVDVE